MTALLLIALFACGTATQPPSVIPQADAHTPQGTETEVEAKAPQWRGEFCSENSECNFDEMCGGTRCMAKDYGPIVMRCPEYTAPHTGSCSCEDSQCTQKPTDISAATSTSGTCSADVDCALDVGAAKCHVAKGARLGPITTTGGFCTCEQGACALQWVEPVSCESWRDCDVEHEPRLHPVKAAKPRTKKIEPCKDAPVDAVCDTETKTCKVLSWRC